MAVTGKEIVYGSGGIDIRYLWIAVGFAVVAAAATVWIVARHLQNPTQACNPAMTAAWLGWVIVPPLWFAFEYLVLFKLYGPPNAFEAFKHAQDVAAKVWLGIATVLTVIVAH